MDTATTPQQPERRRKLSRGERRHQLIEATISVIAERGYARTTLGDVARAAGLSHGLVNFHFESKEKLLAETLKYLAEDYRQTWMQAVSRAGEQVERQLDAFLRADFDPAVLTPGKLAAWTAFWGEAQNRPLYQEHCSTNDQEYIRVLEGMCARMIADHGYAGDPVRVARVIRLTGEGLWLDLMNAIAPYSVDEALRTMMTCTAAFFPRHFTPDGLIDPPA